MCYFLFYPVKWNKRVAWTLAGVLGAASAFTTHAVLMWTTKMGHYSGWPTSIAVGVIIALAVVRMTRERFLPMEENIVSRRVSRVYEPTLRWILEHKKTFLLIPLTILFRGITIWLGIGTTLKPVA